VPGGLSWAAQEARQASRAGCEGEAGAGQLGRFWG
jgi:hypothetical protein